MQLTQHRLRIAGVLFGVSVMITLVSSSQQPTPDVVPDKPIPELRARPGQEMYELCRALNRPCGKEIARSNQRKLSQAADLHLKRTSARSALDAVANRHPGHQWALRDSVLVLEPKKRVGKDLLGRKLDHILIRDMPTFEAALAVLAQAKIRVAMVSAGNPLNARISLDLRNVTVRQALNAIVKADGQVMWSFVSPPPDQQDDPPKFDIVSWRADGVLPFETEPRLPRPHNNEDSTTP